VEANVKDLMRVTPWTVVGVIFSAYRAGQTGLAWWWIAVAFWALPIVLAAIKADRADREVKRS
jgi:hypothetical protein